MFRTLLKSKIQRVAVTQCELRHQVPAQHAVRRYVAEVKTGGFPQEGVHTY